MDILGLIDIPTWLLVILLLVTAGYIYFTWTFNAFDGYGLPGPKPYPMVGTMGPSFTKGFVETDIELMQKYGKTVTMFLGRTPSIFTMDEDLIKNVLIKEFNSFSHRMSFAAEGDITSDMLSVANGDKWRRLRHLMSPTFSSGKLKRMNQQVNRCAKIFITHMEEYAKMEKPVEIKTATQAFTMDTIAATAFGLDLNTQADPDNPFVKMGKKAFDFSIFSPLFIVAFFFPFLLPVLQKFKISFFDKNVLHFFQNLTEQAIAERKTSEKKHVDFLQLMLNAHEDTENDVTDEAINNDTEEEKVEQKRLTNREMNAQGILFFLAGFETTAATLTFLCYCMAVYPEAQEKLYQEISKHMKGKDEIDYSMLGEMPFLDQCINESMRIYPIAFRSDRICQKDITIKGIHFKKGWSVVFPIYAMHHDPELWDEPEKFKPERFEDMSEIGCKFMPFGMGPRNCIGMRLALMEIKMLIIHLIKDFKLIKTEETQFPLVFNKRKLMQPETPIKIGVEKRV